MLTITRKDLLLTVNDNVIPAMGSSDVPVKFVNDTETYVDFLIEPRVGYYVNGCPKSTVCEYDTSSNIIKIPAEAFKNKGILVIAIALIDNVDSNHIEVTKELALEVTPAPNGTVILPATDTWQTAVDNLVEQLYNQDYKPLYDKALEDINEAVKTANTASSDATTALNTANQTNKLINQKANDGSFIPNITVGETATGAAGTEADVEITGTKKEPILNFTIPKGQDGSGQTTVKKDEDVLTELDLNTERTATPTTVKVQLKDTSGNTFYVETSPECVYLKGTDGSEISQKNLNDKIGQLINLVALYSASPVSVLTDLKKYITTIS